MYTRKMQSGAIILGSVSRESGKLNQMANDLRREGWKIFDIKRFNCAGLNFTEFEMRKSATGNLPATKFRPPNRRYARAN